jgi:hypothetical protein
MLLAAQTKGPGHPCGEVDFYSSTLNSGCLWLHIPRTTNTRKPWIKFSWLLLLDISWCIDRDDSASQYRFHNGFNLLKT